MEVLGVDSCDDEGSSFSLSILLSVCLPVFFFPFGTPASILSV